MVDYSNIPRDSRRVPIETRVQFTFDRFSGFILEYSSNISPGGMFLKTRTPLPTGKVIDFECSMGDGYELIKGRAEVVWSRLEDEGADRPAGMGIRFLELSEGSKELIYRMVDQHIAQGGTPFDVTQGETLSMMTKTPSTPPDDDDPTDASHWLPKLDDVLEPDLPEPPTPIAHRHAPTFATFGTAAAKPPRSPWPWILIGVVVAMGLIFYLMQDAILDYILGPEVVSAPAPASRAPRPTVRPAQSVPDPLTSDAGPAEPAATATADPASEVTAAVPPPAATAAPGPARTAPPPATAPPSGPPLTVIETIVPRAAAGGGTEIVLVADGVFSADRFVRTRLEGNPPRELFRITRVAREFPTPRIAVGTSEVLQVRVGYHPEQNDELHVVLDLAHPAVQVVGVEPVGRELRIRLLRR